MSDIKDIFPESIHDIAVRKQLEEALQNSEERYRSLFQNAVEGIVVAETETRRFLHANPAFCKMLGYSNEEICAMHVEDIHPAQSLENVLDEFRAHTSGKKVLVEDIPCLRKDGTILYADIAGSAIIIDGKMCNVGFFNNVTERKKLNDALRESEERYRLLVDKTETGFVVIDDKGIVMEGNEPYMRLIGAEDKEEIIGHSVIEWTAPEEQDSNAAAVALCSRQGYIQDFETIYLHRDGTRVYINVNATTHETPGGKRIVSFCRNITERKKIEETLILIRSAIESSGEAIGMSTPQGSHFYQNKAFSDLFGYSVEELNIPLAPIVVYADHEVGREVFETIIEGNPWVGEAIMVAKSGRQLPVSLRADAIKDKDGNIIGLIGIHTDITKRKQVEEASRESEIRLHTVIEAVQEGITFSDEKGHFEAYNSSMERLTGYSADEANASSDYTTLIYPDPIERGKALAGLNELTAIGESREAETRIRTKDGIQKHILVSTTLIPYRDRKMFLSSYHDITGRKLLEKQITKLGFLKERLIGTLGLSQKLKLIADGIVNIFGADFARIWLIQEGDLCDKGCIHAKFKEGPDACLDKARCLHLITSSGRYTHIDGNHRRVPFGCYKIGRIASGDDSRFTTNDVTRDPRVHDHEWAQALGLVSFTGFRLISSEDTPIGALALFSKQAISPVEEDLMAGLVNYLSQVIQFEKARESLLESETKFRALFENANDAIFLLKEDIFIDCNTRTLDIFQCSKDQIVGQTPYRFSPPLQPDGRDSKEEALEKIYAALAGNPQFFDWEHCHYDGTPFDAEVSLNTVKLGSELFIQAIVRDITERKLLEEELRTLSIVDELTGLFNRRGFLTLSEQQLKIAERTKKSLVLFFMDIDRLKWINDMFGHLEGDTALVETTAILRQTVRKSDIIGRMGGDEFAVLAIDTAYEVQNTVARLHDALDNCNKSETRKYKLSLSVGTAYFDPENPNSLDELIAAADNLMYEEKKTKQHKRE